MVRRLATALLGFGLGTACTTTPTGDRADDLTENELALPAPRERASEAPAQERAAAPKTPAVVYVGRFDLGDPAGAKTGWSGSRIVLRFEGTEIRVRLAETKLEESGPSHYDVDVDGRAVKRLVTSEGTHDYVLAEKLAAGEHLIELTRLTEGQIGTTQFLGFDYRGGKLLAPPPPRAHVIEFLGDSNTTGYGVEGSSPDCPFAASTENFRKTWASLVARDLDAEAIGIAYSGKGVVQNNDRHDPVLFSELFQRTLPESPTPRWNFATVPDAVVINLGSNDYAQPNDHVVDPPALDVFTRKYGELVDTVRSKYPKAHIFCALSPTQKDEYPWGFDARTNQTKAFSDVVSTRNRNGDARVHLVLPPEASESERTGCHYHPGAALHRRIADVVVARIREETGW